MYINIKMPYPNRDCRKILQNFRLRTELFINRSDRTKVQAIPERASDINCEKMTHNICILLNSINGLQRISSVRIRTRPFRRNKCYAIQRCGGVIWILRKVCFYAYQKVIYSAFESAAGVFSSCFLVTFFLFNKYRCVMCVCCAYGRVECLLSSCHCRISHSFIFAASSTNAITYYIIFCVCVCVVCQSAKHAGRPTFFLQHEYASNTSNSTCPFFKW